ncbi:Hypothetical_protein [Hexamita inflata]|uniref:Hypothetical_protein n=1 Tax=Hexamita inflata TaxID=28002 RepID=A0AA86PTW4_9EUKA|nr:Hypothetical protein HINF_LOCUS33396 [Hexamita inflata]
MEVNRVQMIFLPKLVHNTKDRLRRIVVRKISNSLDFQVELRATFQTLIIFSNIIHFYLSTYLKQNDTNVNCNLIISHILNIFGNIQEVTFDQLLKASYCSYYIGTYLGSRIIVCENYVSLQNFKEDRFLVPLSTQLKQLKQI